MTTARRALVAACAALAATAALPVAGAQAEDSPCASAPGVAAVAAPGHAVAWRAGIEARTAVFARLPTETARPARALSPDDAPFVLVVGPPRDAAGHCWLQVRLPWRPNRGYGWIDAGKVTVEQTPWRIDISRRRRTLTVYRSGRRIRSLHAVVGKPGTPTPAGLFAVTWAIRWHAQDFLGSWVLELTAHSDVLQRYDGGDGTVGIHGRGGASLLDPLGSARSHGCVRLSNAAIGWLVRRIGLRRLSGTPVKVR